MFCSVKLWSSRISTWIIYPDPYLPKISSKHSCIFLLSKDIVEFCVCKIPWYALGLYNGSFHIYFGDERYVCFLQSYRRYLKQVEEGKQSTRSVHNIISINDADREHSLLFGHSPLNSRIHQLNSQFSIKRPNRTPTQPGCSGTISTPPYSHAHILDPKASATTYFESMGQGQTIPVTYQQDLKPPSLRYVSKIDAAPLKNSVSGSYFGIAEHSTHRGLTQVGSTHFQGDQVHDNSLVSILSTESQNYANECPRLCTSSPCFGGIRMTGDGKYVGNEQGGLLHDNEIRSMGQNSGCETLNQYPLMFMNSSNPHQQHSLPPTPPLLQDESQSFMANEDIDFSEDEIIQLFLSSDFDNLISKKENKSSSHENL